MATLTNAPEALAAPAPVRGRFLASFTFGALAILALVAGAAAGGARSVEGRAPRGGAGGEPRGRLAFAGRPLVSGSDVGPAVTFDRDALRGALEGIAAGLGS